jgi:hypothetical protein
VTLSASVRPSEVRLQETFEGQSFTSGPIEKSGMKGSAARSAWNELVLTGHAISEEAGGSVEYR